MSPWISIKESRDSPALSLFPFINCFLKNPSYRKEQFVSFVIHCIPFILTHLCPSHSPTFLFSLSRTWKQKKEPACRQTGKEERRMEENGKMSRTPYFSLEETKMSRTQKKRNKQRTLLICLLICFFVCKRSFIVLLGFNDRLKWRKRVKVCLSVSVEFHLVFFES